MTSSPKQLVMARAIPPMLLAIFLLNAASQIPVHSFQLSQPPIATTGAGASRITSLGMHEHTGEADAAVTANAAPPPETSSSDEWIQHDLEAQLRDARLSDGGTSSTAATEAIKIIFSDIDGSLIHYPKNHHDDAQHDADSNEILSLPPSATGMRGIISSRTLATCRDLRLERGLKLVLVTGARTSTLLNRLPYLPKADAYCTEAGGRIFYPIDINDECCHEEGSYTPLDYDGAADGDLKSFGLKEDMIWRERMERGGAGTEAYAGNEVFSNRCSGDESEEECMIDYESIEGFPFVQDEVPIDRRNGHLWDFASHLVEEEGFVLDTKSYSTCFRVNEKHQTKSDKFKALLAGDIGHPEATIGKSTNLGCIDLYPIVSGKKNCCQYIADELGLDLATESVCICDDDNDIEMALACSHTYIPSLTSKSMLGTLRKNGSDFTLTFGPDVGSTAATEAALNSIFNGNDR